MSTDHMERLLFHSNPVTRTEEELKRLKSGGWVKYNPRLYYEYIVTTILPKLRKEHLRFFKKRNEQNDFYLGTRLLSREHLLTSLYETFYSSTFRGINDNSSAIISYTVSYKKTKYLLKFISVRIENNNIQIHDSDESNESESSCNSSVSTASTIVTSNHPTNNSEKPKKSSPHPVTTEEESETKADDIINFNGIFSRVGKISKNFFFRHYLLNKEKTKGYLMKPYDLLDMILIIQLKQYYSQYGQDNFSVRKFVDRELLRPIGDCRFMLPMLFKDDNSLFWLVRDRLRLDKHKVNYEEIHWSINPEKENIEKCEKSAREDDWFIFLERLKYGITLSAYQRIVEAFEYYICYRSHKTIKVSYLNDEEIKYGHSINLDNYSQRYDFLHVDKNKNNNICNEIEESIMDATQPPLTQEFSVRNEKKTNDWILPIR